MTHDELKAWAGNLTEEQLGYALNEMRDRGAAVAYYDAGEILTMFDGDDLDPEEVHAWMPEWREDVEEAMCEAARDIFKRELVDVSD